MSKSIKIRAAGAVVLRGEGDDREVLAVHRQRYDDWSLPKGKGKVDELAPHTAIREVLEETGYSVRLGLRLPSMRYQVSKGPKKVEYWRAEIVEEVGFEPSNEVDRVRWMPIHKAMRKALRPEHLMRITTPTLILAPVRDGVVPFVAMERLAQTFRASRLIPIPGARHELLMESDRYRVQAMAALLAFLPQPDESAITD